MTCHDVLLLVLSDTYLIYKGVVLLVIYVKFVLFIPESNEHFQESPTLYVIVIDVAHGQIYFLQLHNEVGMGRACVM